MAQNGLSSTAQQIANSMLKTVIVGCVKVKESTTKKGKMVVTDWEQNDRCLIRFVPVGDK